MKIPKIIGALIICCVFVLWAIAQLRSPPLHLTLDGDKAVFDMQTLGEYQTTINRIRIRELKTHLVVWEVFSRGEAAQLHTISVSSGLNPTQLKAAYGSYQVQTPLGRDFFDLRRDVEYQFEVWGQSRSYFSKCCIFKF